MCCEALQKKFEKSKIQSQKDLSLKKEQIFRMKQSQQEFLRKQKKRRDKDEQEKKRFIQHHQQIRKKWEADRNRFLQKSLDMEIILNETFNEQDKV